MADSIETTSNTPLGVKPRQRPPSLLACITCRKKHLKCDAQMPRCGRCQYRSLECVYTQSRRGYKGPRKPGYPGEKLEPQSDELGDVQESHDVSTLSATALPLENVASVELRRNSSDPHALAVAHEAMGSLDSLSHNASVHYLGPKQATEAELFSTHHVMSNLTGPADMAVYSSSDFASSQSNSPGYHSGSTTSHSGEIPASSRINIQIGDRFVSSFYNCFHPAHPFVVPPEYYARISASLPTHLHDAMRFVGSHFVPGRFADSLKPLAMGVLCANVPDEPYKVQSLFLLTMAMFARSEPEPALEALQKCVVLALQLGMNYKEFSSFNGHGDPILGESWRRTWWDLYVVDGLVSAIDGLGWVSQLRDVPTDVPLPCECIDYMQCRPVTSSQSLTDMEHRAFASSDQQWSSFAYEVEAVRIMHSVIQSGNEIMSDAASIEALDASLSGFVFSLPPSKRNLIEENGKVDEILFSAHMALHWASIMLHRPRSNLTILAQSYPTACSTMEVVKPPVLSYSIHTSKTLRAANEISKMISIRVPLSVHTPCFVCAIAKAAVVHLPAYTLEGSPPAANVIKQRLQLAVNALNTMGEVWPMAKMVKAQVSQYAREALTIPRLPSSDATAGSFVRQIDLSAFADDSWLEALGRYDGSGLAYSDRSHPSDHLSTLASN